MTPKDLKIWYRVAGSRQKRGTKYAHQVRHEVATAAAAPGLVEIYRGAAARIYFTLSRSLSGVPQGGFYSRLAESNACFVQSATTAKRATWPYGATDTGACALAVIF